MWLPDLKSEKSVAVELHLQAAKGVWSALSFLKSAKSEGHELVYFTYKRGGEDHYCAYLIAQQVLSFRLSEPQGLKLSRSNGNRLIEALEDVSAPCRFVSRFAFGTDGYTTPLIPSASMLQTRFRKENDDFDFLPVGIRYKSRDGAADLIIDRSSEKNIHIQFSVPIQISRYDELSNLWRLSVSISQLMVIERGSENAARTEKSQRAVV